MRDSSHVGGTFEGQERLSIVLSGTELWAQREASALTLTLWQCGLCPCQTLLSFHKCAGCANAFQVLRWVPGP